MVEHVLHENVAVFSRIIGFSCVVLVAEQDMPRIEPGTPALSLLSSRKLAKKFQGDTKAVGSYPFIAVSSMLTH